MKFNIRVTDNDWFRFLNQIPLDEVNFWMPSGKQGFDALQRGEPLLFKLAAPNNHIAGGGFFVTFRRLPVSLAWRAFGEKNGVASETQFRAIINKHRAKYGQHEFDPVIGNIILTAPFFFKRSEWLNPPEDWHPNIQQGKNYDTSTAIGAKLWSEVEQRLQTTKPTRPLAVHDVPEKPAPVGRGAFEIMVTEAYHRRCAITGEKTLPVLKAAHIKPPAKSGINETSNGLLLRADVDILFRRGYLTVTPDYRVEVSRRIKEDYENGRDYYARQGQPLVTLPADSRDRPANSLLRWHNENVYLG